MSLTPVEDGIFVLQEDHGSEVLDNSPPKLLAFQKNVLLGQVKNAENGEEVGSCLQAAARRRRCSCTSMRAAIESALVQALGEVK